jgi:hypothetical protein
VNLLDRTNDWLDQLGQLRVTGVDRLTDDLLQGVPPLLPARDTPLNEAMYALVARHGARVATDRATQGSDDDASRFWRSVADYLSQPPPDTDAAPISPESQAMMDWLITVAVTRPLESSEITVELLAVVGEPPVPPRSPGGSMKDIMAYGKAKAFGKLMSERLSRQGWLEFGEAEKAGDAAGQEEGRNKAMFWKHGAAWFNTM